MVRSISNRASIRRTTSTAIGEITIYWLMWSLRTLMPRRSRWRAAQFDTLRLRLIKLAVRIEVLKTKVRLHLPRATPDQALFASLLARMPRLSI